MEKKWTNGKRGNGKLPFVCCKRTENGASLFSLGRKIMSGIAVSANMLICA
jgi:hypothetical protein